MPASGNGPTWKGAWRPRGERWTAPSILLHNAHAMILCCCWPVHKCVTVLSLLDTVVAGILAYKSFNALSETIYEPNGWTICTFLFFTFFFICQVIATVCILMAHRKNIARYCYPRIALLSGLVICASIATIVVIFYFMGGSKSMNSFFFSLYEWFFGEALSDVERAELKGELRLYAAAFLALSLVFALYSVFEWLLTRKFYQSLCHFSPVPQEEPTAPPPAFNPDYGTPPTKMYPNVA